jgi:elongation factor Ts
MSTTTSIITDQVRSLRQKTGAGFLDCRKAIEAAKGNEEEAIVWLRQRGIQIGEGTSGRKTTEGTIGSYIHTGGQIGVLIEVNCETDFVARTEEFQTLVKELAMQVAAFPSLAYVSLDAIPEVVKQKEYAIEAGKNDLGNKPEAIRQKIVEGRVSKKLKELSLLDQASLKDGSITVANQISALSGKVGENITVKRFVRFTVGN